MIHLFTVFHCCCASTYQAVEREPAFMSVIGIPFTGHVYAHENLSRKSKRNIREIYFLQL